MGLDLLPDTLPTALHSLICDCGVSWSYSLAFFATKRSNICWTKKLDVKSGMPYLCDVNFHLNEHGIFLKICWCLEYTVSYKEWATTRNIHVRRWLPEATAIGVRSESI